MRAKPIKHLTCCCCGDGTTGRQWWNRDTGFGICSRCIARQRSRGTSEAEIRSMYGVEGINFNIHLHDCLEVSP